MKKLISLLIVCSMIMLMSAAVFGDEEGPKNTDARFESFKIQMLQNNTALKKLTLSEKQAELKYNDAVDAADKMSILGQTIYIQGHPHTMYYPSSVQYLLRKQQAAIPGQAKYYLDIIGWNKKATQNALINNTWSLYMGLTNLDMSLELQKKKLELAQKLYNADKLKFDKGMITENDLNLSNYNLTLTQNTMTETLKSRENMERSLNSILGQPLNNRLEKILLGDVNVTSGKLENVDLYISAAKSNRMELLDLQEQIDMKRNEIAVIEEFFAYANSDKAVMEDYDDACTDLDFLQFKLDAKKVDVEKEIRNAYLDVLNSQNDIDRLKDTLDNQRRSLERTKALFNSGQIGPNDLEQAELGVVQVENQYKIACLNYNGKMVKLQQASDIGPAY